jgi:hypothetical protein
MDFKFPTERLPFSLNPNPASLPAALVERETADVSTNLPDEYRAKSRRRVTRAVLDNFWLDVGFAHWSASMQNCPSHPLHGFYEDRARENRERIARELSDQRRVA